MSPTSSNTSQINAIVKERQYTYRTFLAKIRNLRHLSYEVFNRRFDSNFTSLTLDHIIGLARLFRHPSVNDPPSVTNILTLGFSGSVITVRPEQQQQNSVITVMSMT